MAELFPVTIVPAWYDEALCAQTDAELFFPEKGGSTALGKRVCAQCPVATQCLDCALARGERFDIWGGKSERERRAMEGYGADPASGARNPAATHSCAPPANPNSATPWSASHSAQRSTGTEPRDCSMPARMWCSNGRGCRQVAVIANAAMSNRRHSCPMRRADSTRPAMRSPRSTRMAARFRHDKGKRRNCWHRRATPSRRRSATSAKRAASNAPRSVTRATWRYGSRPARIPLRAVNRRASSATRWR